MACGFPSLLICWGYYESRVQQCRVCFVGNDSVVEGSGKRERFSF